ncbi:MAG TPA: response regulator [Caldithrix abyssi]|uniref:Response regulator n=1 Tax=Caldithrix abyssi TaxID=187145 RepID=A0A7V4TZ58_CALAY|nr:response regulator [Caldithrix abyssi]
MTEHQQTGKLSTGIHRILLVDDEEMIREMTREILTYLGYEVVVASGGEEAIDIYKREKEHIDLLIVDLIMPKMNGVACFEQIRNLDKEVPIVISSGISEITKKESILKMGAAAYIEKPYTIDGLQSTLQSISMSHTEP